MYTESKEHRPGPDQSRCTWIWSTGLVSTVAQQIWPHQPLLKMIPPQWWWDMHIHALRVTAEIPLSKLLKAGPQSPGWQRCSSTYLDGWKGSNENWWWRARARLVGSAIMFDQFPPILAKILSGVFSMGITRDTTFLSLLHLETAFLWIILLQLFFLHS